MENNLADYGAFVWSAYGISFTMLLATTVFFYARLRVLRKKVNDETQA